MLTADDLKKIEVILKHWMDIEEGWLEEQFKIVNKGIGDLKKTLQRLEETLERVEKRIK